MNKHIEELHKIREENAKKKKGMSIKEKLKYMLEEAEKAHKNLNLKPKTDYSKYSQTGLPSEIITEEPAKYNSDENKNQT